MTTIAPNTQMGRILAALSDGEWHSAADIQRRVGSVRLSSRISDLRHAHGYKIEHRHVGGKARAPLSHQYRLIDPPQDIPSPNGKPGRTILDRDAVPRTPEHRYRLYRLYQGELELVATCKDETQIGRTILEYGARGEFSESCIGLLDTKVERDDQEPGPGSWILQPWDTEPLT